MKTNEKGEPLAELCGEIMICEYCQKEIENHSPAKYSWMCFECYLTKVNKEVRRGLRKRKWSFNKTCKRHGHSPYFTGKKELLEEEKDEKGRPRRGEKIICYFCKKTLAIEFYYPSGGADIYVDKFLKILRKYRKVEK